MTLLELNPRWVNHGGEGFLAADGSEVPFRERVAVSFDCPCGKCGRICILFANPVDGLGPVQGMPTLWHREGDSFETLTLSPSILHHGCGWHGFLREGKITS